MSLVALLSGPSDAITLEDVAGLHRWGTISAAAHQGARRLGRRLPPGARVALALEPGADWLASFLAILHAGCAAVPLSARQPDGEAAERVSDAGAELVIGERSLGVPNLAAAELLAPDAGGDLPPAPDGGALALLLFTSGTTGRPKGVELTHDHLAAGALALIDAWDLEGRRALLHALPLHHMHGLAIALLPCLAAGMRAVMLPTFDAVEVWRRLADVDTFMAVPTMYHRLLERFDAEPELQEARRAAARQLSLSVSGSAALASRTAARWAELSGAIPLERWGMTEVGVGLSNPLDPAARRLGRVGRPIGALEAELRDGELLVRGPSVFSRYWQRPDDTREAFTEDGWFRTGDAAERDADGAFRILGRRSIDILKSGGFKLSALEIEEHLREHPEIRDVAVVGLPDEAYGEIVAAAVVATAEPDLAPWCKERMASYKVPRRYLFVDALPLNAVGKVDKRAVRDLFTAPRR